MFEIHADQEKNRLYICLAGYLEDAEVQQIAQAVTAAVKDLHDGFTVISDISELHPSHESNLKVAVKVMRMLKLRGVSRVVRVSRIALSRLQMDRSSREAGVDVEEASSVEQAEQLLDTTS